jgi:hypothetical protein
MNFIDRHVYFTQFKYSVDITCVSVNVTLFVTKL